MSHGEILFAVLLFAGIDWRSLLIINKLLILNLCFSHYQTFISHLISRQIFDLANGRFFKIVLFRYLLTASLRLHVS